MGTNYYAVKKVSNEKKKLMIELLMEDKYDDFDELYNSELKKIHIGKSSCGWKFLFNYNHFKFYEPTKESINNFLSSEDVTIYDEYGDKISVDKFWEMVDLKKGGIDNKEYYSKYEETFPYMMLEESIPSELIKYNAECYEFYSDGLRFSTSCDFS